ncbi:unnamed protein product [Echinostoma caproni]|uniref:CUPID domain-containing protein n=1 Tax=Echinostoma caproni TaxID=27848 RepID=A0A183BDK2_9TREM|nr:unnamed protein product [Echinostoma caproni]
MSRNEGVPKDSLSLSDLEKYSNMQDDGVMYAKYKQRIRLLESALKEARITDKMTSGDNLYSDAEKNFGESPAVESSRSLPIHADINDHPPKIVHDVLSGVLLKVDHGNMGSPAPSPGCFTFKRNCLFRWCFPSTSVVHQKLSRCCCEKGNR